MLEEYKKVLERRRTQILEQVRWNKEISNAFVDRGIFSRSDIQEIELDLSPKNRMFAALSKLMKRSDPGTFEKFRQLLQDCGHLTMADSLDFDRTRIHWDFEREQLATSLPNYIDHMIADVLQPSATETDNHLRSCLLAESRRRLESLRNSLGQIQRDRDSFRRDLQELITDHNQNIHITRENGLSAKIQITKSRDESCSPDTHAANHRSVSSNEFENGNDSVTIESPRGTARNRINSASNILRSYCSIDSNYSRTSRTGSRVSGARNQRVVRFMNLSELEDQESDRDKELLKRMSQTLEGYARSLQELEEENALLRSRLESDDNLNNKEQGTNLLHKSSRSNIRYQKNGQHGGSLDSDSDLDPLRQSDSDVTGDDDDDVIRISINKSTIDQMFAQILSNISSTSQHSIDSWNKRKVSSYTEKILDILIAAATELEESRNRSQRLGQAIEQLQLERETIADRLGLQPPVMGDRDLFTHTLLQRFDELQAFANELHHSQRPRPPGSYFIKKSPTDVDLEKNSKKGSGNRSNSGDGGSTMLADDERKRKISDPTQQRNASPKLLPLRKQSTGINLYARSNGLSTSKK